MKTVPNDELTLNQLFKKRDYLVRLIEDCGYDLETELVRVEDDIKERIIESRMSEGKKTRVRKVVYPLI